MCENLEIAVNSTNNQVPLVDIEKLVVDNGIRINRKYVNINSGETVFVLPSKNDADSFKSKFSKTFPNTALREKQQLQIASRGFTRGQTLKNSPAAGVTDSLRSPKNVTT